MQVRHARQADSGRGRRRGRPAGELGPVRRLPEVAGDRRERPPGPGGRRGRGLDVRHAGGGGVLRDERRLGAGAQAGAGRPPQEAGPGGAGAQGGRSGGPAGGGPPAPPVAVGAAGERRRRGVGPPGRPAEGPAGPPGGDGVEHGLCSRQAVPVGAGRGGRRGPRRVGAVHAVLALGQPGGARGGGGLRVRGDGAARQGRRQGEAQVPPLGAVQRVRQVARRRAPDPPPDREPRRQLRVDLQGLQGGAHLPQPHRRLGLRGPQGERAARGDREGRPDRRRRGECACSGVWVVRAAGRGRARPRWGTDRPLSRPAPSSGSATAWRSPARPSRRRCSWPRTR